MTKNFIIPVIIIYLILVNILSLTLVLVRNRRQYEKRGKSQNSLLLITLSVLGGGFGVLFGLMIRNKETKAPVFMAVASLTLLWILLPAAAVLLEPVSGDSSLPLQTRAAEHSPGSSESVLVASTEFSDPSAAVIEGIGSISRSESTPCCGGGSPGSRGSRPGPGSGGGCGPGSCGNRWNRIECRHAAASRRWASHRRICLL